MKAIDYRTKRQFAECIKDLVEKHSPIDDKIRLVMDNLNKYWLSHLYETFEPENTRRRSKNLDVHHTPKHASWLNMAKIEISIREE